MFFDEVTLKLFVTYLPLLIVKMTKLFLMIMLLMNAVSIKWQLTFNGALSMRRQTVFDESCFDETSNCFRWIFSWWNFKQFSMNIVSMKWPVRTIFFVLLSSNEWLLPPANYHHHFLLETKRDFFFGESFKKFGFWLKPFCDDGSRIMFKFYTLPSFDK